MASLVHSQLIHQRAEYFRPEQRTSGPSRELQGGAESFRRVDLSSPPFLCAENGYTNIRALGGAALVVLNGTTIFKSEECNFIKKIIVPLQDDIGTP